MNEILGELLPRVREVLGERFVGMYLDGSLALGDFDGASDVDFVVTEEEASTETFEALRKMHNEVACLGLTYSTELEGSYLSRQALWRHDAANERHPNIERGMGERLKMTRHDSTLIVHRFVMREHGIVLYGPAPHTLVDAVSPDELREAMLQELQSEWTAQISGESAAICSRGYQSHL